MFVSTASRVPQSGTANLAESGRFIAKYTDSVAILFLKGDICL
jgi:hypothetical protein